MKRLGLVVVALALGSCAVLKAVGDATGGQTGRALSTVGEAGLEMEKCDALATKQVSYEEETQIGGAVALALAAKTSGVFIELSPDLPAGQLDPAAWARKKPKPGSGDKTALTTYLDELGKGLAAASGRPDIDWTFVVLDSATPNAFSAPGGYVFITTAMLKSLQNEAQLAAVLAHEIGHVTGRHAIEQYQASKVSACKWAIGLKKGGSLLAGPVIDAIQRDVDSLVGMRVFNVDGATAEFIEKLTDTLVDSLTSTGMGSEHELAADRATIDLMVFSGYDPGEYEKLLKTLPEGGGMTPHPKNADRVAGIKEYREKELAGFASGGKAPPLPDRVKVATK